MNICRQFLSLVGKIDNYMKVLLVNGSPHKEGCTYTALKEVEKELNAAGVASDIREAMLPEGMYTVSAYYFSVNKLCK